jgi:hypothetical protein
MCECGAIRDERLELPDGICVPEAISGSNLAWEVENQLSYQLCVRLFPEKWRIL